jgi:hypothetical protein
MVLGPIALKPVGGIERGAGKIVPNVPGLRQAAKATESHHRQNGDPPNEHVMLPMTMEHFDALLFPIPFNMHQPRTEHNAIPLPSRSMFLDAPLSGLP